MAQMAFLLSHTKIDASNTHVKWWATCLLHLNIKVLWTVCSFKIIYFAIRNSILLLGGKIFFFLSISKNRPISTAGGLSCKALHRSKVCNPLRPNRRDMWYKSVWRRSAIWEGHEVRSRLWLAPTDVGRVNSARQTRTLTAGLPWWREPGQKENVPKSPVALMSEWSSIISIIISFIWRKALTKIEAPICLCV